jgi:hypothetical protein
MTDYEEIGRPGVVPNSTCDQLFSDHTEESEELYNQLFSNQVDKRKSSDTGYNNPNNNNSKIRLIDNHQEQQTKSASKRCKSNLELVSRNTRSKTKKGNSKS